MSVSILSNHRKIAPFGLFGAEAGKVGSNKIRKANGKIIELNSCDQYELEAGDTFIIETPGGGGFNLI